MRTHLSWLGALGAFLAAPHFASADDCPTFTNVIVLSGSSAVQPFILAMSKVLAADPNAPKLLYLKPGSCVGVDAVRLDATPAGACASGACASGAAQFFDTASNGFLACTIPPASPLHVDVGLSDVWYDTCTGDQPIAAQVKDTTGPVEPMVFVMPKAAQQQAITAEEAYFVFGWGAAGAAAPWTVEANLAIRNPKSGTEQIMAHGIDVSAGRWKGNDQGSFVGGAGGVAGFVALSTATESTIGILGADVYDAHRDTLKSLAFQAFHQRGAFFPDSTATSFDKRNVRNGHYVNWGYLHMLTRTDVVSPGATQFLGWVTGATPGPFTGANDINSVATGAKLIPTCAMKVSRKSEGGLIAPSTPTTDCSATFEAAVPH